MAKTSVTAAKTAAELTLLLAQETQAHETAQAEHIQLAAQDAHVARQGVDALRRHRELLTDAELRRDVAGANADGLREQLAEAQQREAAHAKQARIDAHMKGRIDRQQNYSKKLSAIYDEMFALLEMGNADQLETEAINRDLPAGMSPIEHFESHRHTPATPDRYVTVQVERRKDFGNFHARPGQNPPMETVAEQQLVRGERARRPAPLWKSIEMPALDGSNLPRRVVGMQPPQNVLKIA
jgi:hypothetical protein